jgi:hypothetical protein
MAWQAALQERDHSNVYDTSIQVRHHTSRLSFHFSPPFMVKIFVCGGP